MKLQSLGQNTFVKTRNVLVYPLFIIAGISFLLIAKFSPAARADVPSTGGIIDTGGVIDNGGGGESGGGGAGPGGSSCSSCGGGEGAY